MKTLIKRVLLGPHAIRQWEPVPRHEPQDEVVAQLHGFGVPMDVTRNNVIAALRPLTIGICLPDDQPFSLHRRARLVFRDGTPHGDVLGAIQLRASDSIALGASRYWLFRTQSHTNRCLAAPRRWFHYWRQVRAMERSRDGFNFRLIPRELPRLFVFYFCPRPVVLVTVSWQGSMNIFPMDLIGDTASDYFSMALRSTSPSVELMAASRRLVLAGAPFQHTEYVYELGKQHRVRNLDVAALPFATTGSPLFGLPMNQAATRVREVEIEQVHVIGSHHLFLTRVLRDERRATTPQLFHVSGFYHHYREVLDATRGV